ncbi:MAG: hypothetical protein KAT77_04285 [Nanoarchaeota archaeon]|nr:hypothetical protein [Nanoarchaeota archaeon]
MKLDLDDESIGRILIEPSFSVSKVKRIRAEIPEGVPFFVYTRKQLEFLFRTPSLNKKLNDLFGTELPCSPEYTELEFQTRVSHLYSTLDNAFNKGFVDDDFMERKEKKLEDIMAMSGQKKEKVQLSDWDWISQAMNTKKSLVNRATTIKETLSNFLRSMNFDYKLEKRVPEASLGFTDALVDMFGSRISVMLYGSSVSNLDDPTTFDDYDVLVVLPQNRIRSNWYRELQDARLTFQGKPVGVVLVPEDVLANYLYIDSYTINPKNTKVLHGKVWTPSFDYEKNQTVRRELVRTALGIRSLVGTALNWGYFHTLEMMDKPELYHSMIKQAKFTLRSLLNLKDQRTGRPYHPRTKEELERMLEIMKMPIRKHVPRVEYLKDSLLITARDTAELMEKHYQPETSIKIYKNQINWINTQQKKSPNSFFILKKTKNI